jgi:hypothetical protein
MKQSGTTNTLQRLVRRLTAEAHEDEAEALKTVDALMREYAFARDPLTPDAEQFADDLRRLVADWMCAPSIPPRAKEAGAGIGLCAMPPSPGYCAARMDDGRCGAAPFRDCQPCEHLRQKARAGV